ncbi:MAG: Na/Pi cotransporter family protein [Oscillospiraceae bacterium]|nr:Na/Pi cotransporter family protein [Oscillospiraceae bacterium]
MSVLNFISLLGGLALFLYGIALMGDGLNLVAGNKLEVVLYRLTSNRWRGILLGTVVTAVIQSSSAASVMCVGFVNSGLMNFGQAVSVILGSILGSSVTGWIICLSHIGGGGGWVDLLSTTAITGVVAVIGIILRKFSKNPVKHHVGDILMGFAVLMFGMSAMSAAVEPLRYSETFLSLMVSLSHPLLGFLVGAAFTAIIQSSAAAVGILQALSLTGALSFAEAFPLLLGIAVGGALPVLLGALGANINGVRTAVAHLVIDIAGALFCGIVFYAVNAAHPLAFMHQSVGIVAVAAMNTAFRLVTVFALAPMIGLIEKLTNKLVPTPASEVEKAQETEIRLEERFVRYPALALEQSHEVINDMAEVSRQSLLDAIALLDDYSELGYERVCGMESEVDRYEDALGSYLLRITPTELTAQQNENLHKYLHAITDFERISDHARNLGECAKEKYEKSIEFSPASRQELRVLQDAVTEIVDMTIRAFVNDDLSMALRVEPLEEVIDGLCDEMRNHHIDRLQKGICTLQHGFVFNDLLTNYERVGDHCSNVAVALIELEHDMFDTHEYLDSLKIIRDGAFSENYEQFRARFNIENI